MASPEPEPDPRAVALATWQHNQLCNCVIRLGENHPDFSEDYLPGAVDIIRRCEAAGLSVSLPLRRRPRPCRYCSEPIDAHTSTEAADCAAELLAGRNWSEAAEFVE